MRAYKNFKGSLSTLWYGGNYTNRKVEQLYDGRYVITAVKRYSHEVFGKEVTERYAQRILPETAFYECLNNN